MGQAVKKKEASTIKKKINKNPCLELPPPRELTPEIKEKLELHKFTEIMIRVVGAVNKINEDLAFEKNRADLFEIQVKELNQRLSDYEKMMNQ